MNGKMRSCVMGLILGQFSSPLPMAQTPDQKEPVAYLYNGVRLPKLPEWDREKYPYAVIEYADASLLVSGGRLAKLICSSEPSIYTMSGLDNGYNLLGDVLYFGFANDDFIWEWSFALDEPYPPINEWAKLGEEYFDETTFVREVVGAAHPKWANYGLRRVSNGLDYIMLEASEPIPVYE